MTKYISQMRKLCTLVKKYVVFCYRPQRSCGKVIFSQACVKNSVHWGGGCLPQCMLGYTPRADTPSRVDTPSDRQLPWADIPWQTLPPPGSRHPLPADGYCCEWHVSSWNAFLLRLALKNYFVKFINLGSSIEIQVLFCAFIQWASKKILTVSTYT